MQFGQDQSRPISYHNFYVSKVDMSTRDQYRDITGGKASFPQDMEPLLNYMFFGQFSTTTFFYFLFFLSFVLIFS
jgi:hypothetical protein